MPPLLAFDAFCGAGGFSLGFLQAGDYQVVGALDQDPHAALTYLYNLGRTSPFSITRPPPMKRASRPPSSGTGNLNKSAGSGGRG